MIRRPSRGGPGLRRDSGGDMLLELHCHSSKHSACSAVSPLELVRIARAKALQGIVITEHHYLWSDEELLDLRREAEVESRFVILSGQEVSTDVGHVLVYGAGESVPPGTTLAALRKAFPAAALVLAHPYRGGRAVADADLLNPDLDAVEIFSGNHTVRENCRGLVDWHRLKFTAVAGTDSHSPRLAAVYPSHFDHPVGSAAGLAAEIRAGRCRPFFKEIPKSGANLDLIEITIGTKGEEESRPRLIFKSYDAPFAWAKALRAYAVMEEIHRRGFCAGPFRVPAPIDREPDRMTLVEEGLRGRSLYDRLKLGSPPGGAEMLGLAARWLARLHALRLRVTPVEEFVRSEERRLARYVRQFERVRHPMAGAAAKIAGRVRRAEARIVAAGGGSLVQCHGDYHPKNIFIGQDRAEDGETRFVSAIDFEGSHVAPPAFDVGYFLAQYGNQCAALPGVLARYPGALFLKAYREGAGGLPRGFTAQVRIFRARGDLSIASYLISVGKGDSADLRRVMRNAEEALGG